MKKLLTALLLSMVALSATAKETITIIYGFSASDNFANYSRTLVEEANKMQDKYQFLFDVRPGAGQVIAFNYVKKAPNTIFQTSGAYWVRPNFYPTQSYDVHEFRGLMTQCSVPFSVASVKYKSWNEVPKDKPLTIGTSGLGVVSHLTALQIQKNFKDMTIVPFKSTTDAILATVSGQVDFVVGFVSDQEKWTGSEAKVKLNILGTTGDEPVGKYPTLASQGFPQVLTKMNTTSVLMVPTSWNDTKAAEIRKILLEAETAEKVRASYSVDYCKPVRVPADKLKTWWDDQNATWTSLTVGVKIDQ